MFEKTSCFDVVLSIYMDFLFHSKLQCSREVVACQENRYKLQDVMEKMQRSHREMQHSAQKISNEIKVCGC